MKMQTRFAAALMIAAAFAPRAGAQGPGRKYAEMLKRLPDAANVLVLADVGGLLDSPLGKREGWRAKAASRPDGVLGVSPGASKMVVMAGVDLDTLEERWKVGMVEVKGTTPSLSVLATKEGGYVEEIAAQSVAWTPRGFYLLTFPNRIIGFAAPADRQLLAGWLESTLTKPRAYPPGWADYAINRADRGAEVVFAVRLANAIPPKEVELWAKADEAVKRARVDPEVLSHQVTAAKWAVLEVEVNQTIDATLTVEFGDETSYFRPLAKQLVTAALQAAGVDLPDLRGWAVQGAGRSLKLSGRLTPDALRSLLRFAAVPRLAAAESLSLNDPSASGSSRTQAPSAAPSTAPAPQPTRDDVVKATQVYFQSVLDVVADLKQRKPESAQSQKTWYDRSAKAIEGLPLLNVDTDLLEWGSKMARTLREMAYGINYAARDRTYRVSGTANKGGYYAGYGSGYDRGTDVAVIKKQMNAVVGTQLEGYWQTIETNIADMRKALVTKYRVNF